jgi:23S rRNA (cytidine2498-2'-O)-methyltransferase
MKESLPNFGYLAPLGFEKNLENELQKIDERYGRLFFSSTPPEEVFWSQNIWYTPFRAKILSISDGASLLKKEQRNWALYPHNNIRRAHLIEEKLPYIAKKPLTFPALLPKSPLGSWTLIDKDTIIASPKCSSLFPNGELHFIESKVGPPSRAYLKLYEIFTILQKMPQKNENCLELGASPGSWTWVLSPLCAKVFCIDRALLSPNISALKNVHFTKGDAFSLRPMDFPHMSWFFSDLICYPEKLYDFILQWLDHCENFICTLKFQGIANRNIIQSFAKIPNSHIVHLSCNKNELTWFRLKQI